MDLATDPSTLARRLTQIGHRAGLDRVGIAGIDAFATVRSSIEDRVASGMSGGLTFTFNHPERSTDITQSLPWARSLVVGGKAYLPEAGSPAATVSRTGRIARFAERDHYRPLRSALGEIAAALEAAGHRSEVVCDDNRLVDRAAAVRAGVGWWGKNTMVIAPGHGPWMLLGTVVTDAHVEASEPMRRDCGTCDACIPACPTGALVAPGVLDARRCLAALLQQPGSIPTEFRAAVGDRIYGCDDCLEACPPGGRLLDSVGSTRGRVSIEYILTASDAELLDHFDRFYLPRRRPGILRRNALVAAGNSGDVELAALVTSYLTHPDPVLVEHAAWARECLVGSGAGQPAPSGK